MTAVAPRHLMVLYEVLLEAHRARMPVQFVMLDGTERFGMIKKMMWETDPKGLRDIEVTLFEGWPAFRVIDVKEVVTPRSR